MDAFNLVARLTLDSSEYDAALDKVRQQDLPAVSDEMDKVSQKSTDFSKAFASGMKIAAGAVTAVVGAVTAASTAFVKMTGDVASYGDNIDKMSQKMGISAEAYQEWDAVMQHSGTSMETLKASMRTLASAAQSNSDAFKELGITEKQLQSMSQEELFSATITALQNVEDTTKRTYLAGKTLGRGAVELGALLNTSAEDTQAMKDRVHELGGVMSDEAVKAAAKYQDTLQDMSTAFDGLKRNMVSEFLPSVTTVMDGLTELFAGNDGKGLDLINKGILEFSDNLTEILPKALNTGTKIISSVADAATQNLPALLEAGSNAILELTQGAIDKLPALVDAGKEAVVTLVKGINDSLPELIPAAVSAVNEIVTNLSNPETLTDIMNVGAQLMQTLSKGIADAVPKLAESAVDLVLNFADFMLDPDNIVKITTTAFEVVTNLKSGIIAAAPKIAEGALELVGKVIDTIVNTNWIEVGWNIAVGIADGIVSGADRVGQAAYQVGVDIYNKMNEGANKFDTGFYLDEITQGYFQYFNSATGEAEKSLEEFATKYADFVTDTGEGFAFNFTGNEEAQDVINILDDLIKAYEDTGKAAGDLADAYNSVRRARNNLIVTSEQELEDTTLSNLKAASYQSKDNFDIYTKFIKPKLDADKKALEQGAEQMSEIAESTAETVAEKWDGAFATKAIGEYRNLGVVEQLGKVLSEEEQKANTIATKVFSASSEYITRQTNAMDLSLEEQIKLWESVQAQFVEGSKQYLDAGDKITSLEKQRAKELETERKKQQDEEKKQDEERAKKFKQQYEERLKVQKEYEEQVKKINEEIADIQKKYSDTLENETQKIYNSFGLFEKVPERLEVSGIDLMNNLQEQNDRLTKFYTDLDKLESRGVSADLVQEIRDKGVSELDNLDALLDLSDADLENYSKLYEQKNKIAAEQAEKNLVDVKAQIDKQIAEKMSEIDTLSPENGEQMGETFMNAIASGISKGADVVSNAFSNALSFIGTGFDSFTNAASGNSDKGKTVRTGGVTVNVNGIQYQNIDDLVLGITQAMQELMERGEAGYAGA